MSTSKTVSGPEGMTAVARAPFPSWRPQPYSADGGSHRTIRIASATTMIMIHPSTGPSFIHQQDNKSKWLVFKPRGFIPWDLNLSIMSDVAHAAQPGASPSCPRAMLVPPIQSRLIEPGTYYSKSDPGLFAFFQPGASTAIVWEWDMRMEEGWRRRGWRAARAARSCTMGWYL